MKEKEIEPTDVSAVAEKYGIPCRVKVAIPLVELLKPNEYLSSLGIQFSERIDNIMHYLLGHLLPVDGGPDVVIPDEGVTIPYTLTQGPFVREVPITIRAKRQKDGEGKTEIVLSIVPENY
jgi:hypothetical protein